MKTAIFARLDSGFEHADGICHSISSAKNGKGFTKISQFHFRQNATWRMAFEMSTLVANSQAEESRLVNLYMELTGLSESAARSVFMYVCSGDSGTDCMTRVNQLESDADTAPASPFFDLSKRTRA